MQFLLMLTVATALGGILHNPVEFMPRFLRIRTKESDVVPFRLNRVQQEIERQKAVARAAGRPNRFLILKSRQAGVSTYEVGLNFHLVVTRRNMRAFTIAHKAPVAEVLFRTANLFYEKFPGPAKPSRLTPRNKKNLDLVGLNSYFGIGTSKDFTFGRGDTVNRFHWSEMAYTPGSLEDHEKLMTSLRHAAKHGEIDCESTANGYGNLFEAMCFEALDGKGDFTLIFVPWWFDDDCRVAVTADQAREIMASLSDVEKMLVEKHGLDASQIAFRRSEHSTAQKRRDFPQEFPEDARTCFLTSGVTYFDMQVVDQMIRELIASPAPAKVTEIPGGEVIMWEPPQPGLEYVGGADTSEGIKGCDPNGLGICERRTGRQVLSVHGLFDPDDLGDLIVQYALLYNKALVGVERNNHGHAVLRRIRAKGHGASQYEGGWLYYHSPTNESSNAKMGWPTDSITRPIMLNDLRSAVNDRSVQIRDLEMLSECRTFKRQANGKWEHDQGKHDDRLFKWGIALQMRNHNRVMPGFFAAKGAI